MARPQTSPEPPEATHTVPAPHWIGIAFLVLSASLVPWTAWLVVTLPGHAVADHWDLAWAGFDVALAAALAGTAAAVMRRAPWLQGCAASAATLLAADAWFDVLTASGTAAIAEAVTEALLVELPLALLCLWLARHAEAAGARGEAYVARVRRRPARVTATTAVRPPPAPLDPPAP